MRLVISPGCMGTTRKPSFFYNENPMRALNTVVVLSILILHYNMLCYLIHFTMQELVFCRSFSMPFASFSPGPSSIENDANGIEKLLQKTQVS